LVKREFSRIDRVASTVKRILAAPINELARSYGVGLATITDVELSPDLRRGVVYLSVYGEPSASADFLRFIGERSRELQAQLARSLTTKRTPVLSFRSDQGLERSARINQLLHSPPGETENGAGR
jgi:ribosome-binding factor A